MSIFKLVEQPHDAHDREDDRGEDDGEEGFDEGFVEGHRAEGIRFYA